MTLTRIAISLFLVTSASALAERPEAEASQRLAPTWSLGTGLSFGSGSVGASAGGLGGLAATPGGVGGLGGLTTGFGAGFAVVPNVSLERVFSSRFALGVGVEAGVSTNSTVGAPRPDPTWGSAAIGVSPRFTVTPESAPVALTVLATAFTGFASSGGVWAVTPLQEFTYSAQTLSVGAMGGVALEKRFSDRLALRIQAQLARVALNRSWTVLPTVDQATNTVSEGRSVGSFVSASFVPSPSIELRLYL